MFGLQDEAVFFRVEGDEYIFVGTWVDDFLVIGNSKRLYDKFYQHYKIAVDDAIDEADLDFMLGVNFTVSVFIVNRRRMFRACKSCLI